MNYRIHDKPSRAASVALGVSIARHKDVTLHFNPETGEWIGRTEDDIGLGFDYLIRYAAWAISPVCVGEAFEVYK